MTKKTNTMIKTEDTKLTKTEKLVAPVKQAGEKLLAVAKKAKLTRDNINTAALLMCTVKEEQELMKEHEAMLIGGIQREVKAVSKLLKSSISKHDEADKVIREKLRDYRKGLTKEQKESEEKYVTDRGAVSFRNKTELTIDKKKLPDEYWVKVPDTTKINAVISLNGEIEGVTVTIIDNPVVSTT